MITSVPYTLSLRQLASFSDVKPAGVCYGFSWQHTRLKPHVTKPWWQNMSKVMFETVHWVASDTQACVC